MSVTLSDITSALSAGAPYASTITALAELGIDITKAATPDEAQQYDDERKQSNERAADLVSALVANPSDPDAERALSSFDDELCADAGHPIAGGIPEPCITIRVSRYLAHIAAINDSRYTSHFIGELIVPKQPAPAATK